MRDRARKKLGAAYHSARATLESRVCRVLNKRLFPPSDRRLLIVHGGYSGPTHFNIYEVMARFMHAHGGYAVDGLICNRAVRACDTVTTEILGSSQVNLEDRPDWRLNCAACEKHIVRRYAAFCDRLVRQDEHLSPADHLRAESIVEALGPETTVPAYCALDFEGIAVGAYAYQSFQYFFRLGWAPSIPLAEGTPGREYLKSAILHAISAQRILPAYDVIACNDIGKSWGIWADVAFSMGKRILHASLNDLLAPFPRYYYQLSPRIAPDEHSYRNRLTGYPGDARVQRALEGSGDPALVARGEQILAKRFPTRLSPAAVRERLELPLEGRVAVIFAHLCWDNAIAWGHLPVNSFEEWLRLTYEIAAEVQDVTWVFKLHPSELTRARSHPDHNTTNFLRNLAAEQPCPNVRLLTSADVSTADLAQVACVGITLIGSVSYEFPALGVNCITLTQGIHSSLGFTIETASLDAYAESLRSLGGLPPLDDIARRRALAYVAELKDPSLGIDAHEVFGERYDEPFLNPIQVKQFVRDHLTLFRELAGRDPG